MLFSSKKAGRAKTASRTISDSEYYIKQFFERTSPNSIDDLKMAVLKYFANGEISAYTHNTRRKKLQKFFQWMIEEGFIASGPMATIKSGKRILNLAQEPRILSDAFSNFRTGGSLGSEIML